jgi:hypothetical protein
MTFAEEIRQVFTRHYDATSRRPRDYCRLSGELAQISVEIDAQGDLIFTIEEWEADAKALCAEADAAKTLNRR